MIINSRSSNFIFSFPKNFWNQTVLDKWSPYVKRLPLPYDTVENFMNSTIQSVSFPSINMDPASQARPRGKKQEYKNSLPLQELFNREITVTMKTYDGYVNYWIFLENILEYLDFENPEEYMEDLQMRFIDQDGRALLTTQFKKPLFKSMSEISLNNYADTTPDFRTFSAVFGYYSMSMFIEHD